MTPQCSNCGHVNASFASSCTNCGVPLYGPPQQPPQQPSQPPSLWGPSPNAPEYGPTSFGQIPLGAMQAAYMPEVAEAQKSARNALIFSIVGLFCCPPILGLIGLIMGAQARATLKRVGISEGQGLALAAMIIGGLDVVLFILGMLADLVIS